MVSRLPPNVLVDDLIQAGAIGLIEAARNYDSTLGASFETYASIRIRGAILDEIRKSDWTPRTLRRKLRGLSNAIQKVENRFGRHAKPVEIAEEMGLTLTKYNELLKESATSAVLCIEDIGEHATNRGSANDDVDGGPLSMLEDSAFRNALTEVIENLPDREKLVMALYYDEELNLREIGEILEVSESRICQVHGQAVARIRTRMTEWL